MSPEADIEPSLDKSTKRGLLLVAEGSNRAAGQPYKASKRSNAIIESFIIHKLIKYLLWSCYLLVCTFCVWIKYVWAPFWMGRKEGFAEGLKAVADGVRLDDFRS